MLGLSYPNKQNIKAYQSYKKEINSLSKLYKFIKKITNINITEDEFRIKLFSYRKKNVSNSEYKKLFKPTLIFYFFKYLNYFLECCILTSRDIPTISMFMVENNFRKKISIYSNTDLNKSKNDVINEILDLSGNIIFLDDMFANIECFKNSDSINTIHVGSSDNNFIQLFLRIFVILKLIFNIIKHLISNK